MESINWPRTRDILISVICIGIIFWALWSVLGLFVEAIVILLLSMAIAFLITPVVNFLQKYGFPRVLAALLVYLVVLCVIGTIGYGLVVSLVQQITPFGVTIKALATSFPQTFGTTTSFLVKQGGIPQSNIDNAISQLQSAVGNFAQTLPGSVVTFATTLSSTFVNIFLIAVVSFYMTLDGKRIRNSMVSIAPKGWLPNILLFEDALNRVVGNYIRGQLTLALIVGVCTGLICLVVGLGQYALICGVLAFIFETIPMLGPVLASITPLLLSLLLPYPFPRTLVIVGLFVLLQMLESNILGPRIVGHAVGLHPVAAILALLIGYRLFGIFGALLATPLFAALWVVIASIYRSARGESPDQILARKRAPWLRGPSYSAIRRRRRGPTAREGERNRSAVVVNEVEQRDRAVNEDGGEKYAKSDSTNGEEGPDLIYSERHDDSTK